MKKYTLFFILLIFLAGCHLLGEESEQGSEVDSEIFKQKDRPTRTLGEFGDINFWVQPPHSIWFFQSFWVEAYQKVVGKDEEGNNITFTDKSPIQKVTVNRSKNYLLIEKENSMWKVDAKRMKWVAITTNIELIEETNRQIELDLLKQDKNEVVYIKP